MSTAIFPTLPGIGWTFTRAPLWSTLKHQTVSGREMRAAMYSYPLYKYTLIYDFLRTDAAYQELQTLVGFFNARSGSYDSFLFRDPDDNAVVAPETIGVGDGTTTAFQLGKAYGGFAEPVYAPNLTGLSVYVGGALQSPSSYSVGAATGVVTFGAAPAAGAPIAWTGSFYYLTRFAQDSVDFEKFMFNLFQLKKLELQTLKP